MSRRIRWPMAVVERARLLHERGLGYKSIAKALQDEGYAVSWNTVRDFAAYRTRSTPEAA